MSKDFYETIIGQAQNLDELRIIHRFLICDFQIMGKTNEYLRNLIAHRESCILLDMVQCHVPMPEGIRCEAE